MAQSRKSNSALVDENQRLRAQVAQLEDRLDHLSEHGAAAKALQQGEALHREVMGIVSDAVLITDEAGRLKYVSPNAHFIFGHTAQKFSNKAASASCFPAELFDPDLLEQRGEIANIEMRDSRRGRPRSKFARYRAVVSESSPAAVLYVCRDVTERIKIELDHELLSLTLRATCRERTQRAPRQPRSLSPNGRGLARRIPVLCHRSRW